jgi:hypothetical protein
MGKVYGMQKEVAQDVLHDVSQDKPYGKRSLEDPGVDGPIL